MKNENTVKEAKEVLKHSEKVTALLSQLKEAVDSLRQATLLLNLHDGSVLTTELANMASSLLPELDIEIVTNYSIRGKAIDFLGRL